MRDGSPKLKTRSGHSLMERRRNLKTLPNSFKSLNRQLPNSIKAVRLFKKSYLC
jgi:hypothetical protein